RVGSQEPPTPFAPRNAKGAALRARSLLCTTRISPIQHTQRGHDWKRKGGRGWKRIDTRPPRSSTFRGSIPHPAWLLSTLRTPRYRDARKTRSRPARYGFGRMRLSLIGTRQLGMTYPLVVV